MSVVGRNRKAGSIGYFKDSDRVGRPLQPVQVSIGLDDSAERIHLIDGGVFVHGVTGSVVCDASLRFCVRQADADSVHMGDVVRQSENPGIVGGITVRCLRQPTPVVIGVHGHRQADLAHVG